MKLTPKQRRFIDEYLVDLNGTQAAIRAGYSPRTAREMAYENLTKPAIKKTVADRLELRAQEAAQRGEYTLVRIQQRLAVIAEATPDKVLARDIINAATALAKLQGFWRERQEHAVFDHAAYLESLPRHIEGRRLQAEQLRGVKDLVEPAVDALAIALRNPRTAVAASREVLNRSGVSAGSGKLTLEQALGRANAQIEDDQKRSEERRVVI